MGWRRLWIDDVNGEIAETLGETFSKFAPTGTVVEELPAPPGRRAADNAEGARRDPARASYRVSIFLEDSPALDTQIDEIERALHFLRMIAPIPPLQNDAVVEADWNEAWKQNHPRRTVGRRWVISPTFDRSPVEAGKVGLFLEPGQAFGLGTHPSTQLALRLLEDHLRPGQRVLDVGCGSGILALASACLGARPVFACDIDPAAIQATRGAARSHAVDGRLHVVHGSLDGFAVRGRPQALDLIVMNIVASVLQRLLAPARRMLAPRGTLLLSGLLLRTESSIQGELDRQQLRVRERRTDGDWVGLAITS